MYRSEIYDESGLVERVEIERIDQTTIEYRRYDSTLTPVETRPATSDEIIQVDDHDAGLVLDVKRSNVDQAVATLRQWAIDAENTTVTNGNNTTVTQIMMDRLGVFFDRFADLIETR